MPWTFAHPAAVLPLRRFCPSRLNFAALIIGSLTPDLGYYFGLFESARLAHTFAGSLWVCVPSGLVLLGVLCLLRKPLWFLLPQPHRAALAPIATTTLSLRLAALFSAGVSVLIGAWTHNAWDSLTHKSGWLVARVTFLQEPVIRWGAMEVPAYHLLQHLSTLAGTLVLLAAYGLWLRRCPAVVSTPLSEREDRWRHGLLLGMAAAALVIAIPLAIGGIVNHPEYFAWRFFVFRFAVYGTAAFVSLLIPCSILYYMTRRDVKNGHNNSRKGWI